MKDKKPEDNPKTDFKGPVSLDAIFAATSKKKSKTVEVNTDPPVTVPPADTPPVEPTVPPVEPVTPPIVDPVPPVEPVVPPVDDLTETEAFKTAKRLISLGLLEDFSIQTSDEDSGTPISEFIGMTDDNLKEIIKIHKEEKEESISSSYIPKEGLKEHHLKVIEILKNGGDLSDIAETEDKAFDRPFEGFDLEEQQRQVDVLYTDLTSGKGLDHDSAVVLINKEVKNETLKETATKIFDKYRDAHSKYIDDKLEEQRKEKTFKDLNFKENKKALIAKFKESGLKESAYKKVSAEYAKKNSNGEYALIDKLREALNKPEENHELILHLADKGLFNEVYKIQAAQETQKSIVRLASGTAAKGNKNTTTRPKVEADAPWLRFAEAHNSNIKK